MEKYSIVFLFVFVVDLVFASTRHPRSAGAHHELTLVLTKSPCWLKAYGVDITTHRIVLRSTSKTSRRIYEDGYKHQVSRNSSDETYSSIFKKNLVKRTFSISHRYHSDSRRLLTTEKTLLDNLRYFKVVARFYDRKNNTDQNNTLLVCQDRRNHCITKTFYFDWERAHVENIYGNNQTRESLISWMENSSKRRISCPKHALVKHDSKYDSCTCGCRLESGRVDENCGSYYP